MSLEQSMGWSTVGMEVSRTRLELAAENLAHASSTRTEGGGPFRRRVLAIRGSAEAGEPPQMEVREDVSPFRMQFEPGHPDADPEGWVAYPNVDPVREMVEIMASVRAFQSNVTAFNEAKTMYRAALDLGRA